MSVQRVLAQCVKELMQFSRDRLTVGLALMLPLATLLIFGFAIRFESKNVPLAVIDMDQTSLSRAFVERLYGSNEFVPARVAAYDPLTILDRDLARAVVVIPAGTTRQVMQGEGAHIQVLIDATDVVNARLIKLGVLGASSFFVDTQRPEKSVPRIVADLRVWFNPGRSEALYIVPGVYAIILAIFPALLAAIAMVRDKEEGTIIQAYASALNAAELLVGKALAYLVISSAMAIFIMSVGAMIWQLGFVGDPTPLLVATPLFLLDTILIGLLIGARAASQAAAVQAVGSAYAMLTILFSGFLYPLSNVPFPLSLLANVVPARFYIEVTRDAFVRGTGWPGVWYVPEVLALLSATFFFIAWSGLRRMQIAL